MSVVIPVKSAAGTLRAAVECITRQTIWRRRSVALELLLVLNGSDAPTRSLSAQIARGDPRVRVLSLPRANLSAALNLSLRHARGDLLARMDADDRCDPTRLARQVRFLDEHPEISAVGTAFRRASTDGAELATIIPPRRAEEIRWRLLVENTMCHGSVLMRRADVRAVGGYDERCERAQDYELWLRLSRTHRLANLQEVLYTHTARDGEELGNTTPAQADVVAAHMLRAWELAPRLAARSEFREEVIRNLAIAHQGGRGARDAAINLQRLLERAGPIAEVLTCWLYADSRAASIRDRSVPTLSERSKQRQLQRGRDRLRAAGASAVWLWGAGRHTAWVLSRAQVLGVPIAGIVDDHRAGDRVGVYNVQPPSRLRSGDHALLSSDAWEDTLWKSSEQARKRGVRVHRLYGRASRAA